MIAALFLTFLPVSSPAETVPAASLTQAPAEDPALEAKITAAGKDVAKLLELAAACVAAGQEDGAKKVYKKILTLDANNETARKGLRHQQYDGKWFESFAELSKYKREEAARMKQKGLARFKDQWVPEADLPFLNLGWTKDDKGVWANPALLAREKQIAEWKAAGYQFRPDDNSWIAPADVPKWAALQWKCGEEWVDLAQANAFHSKVEQSWELSGERFETWATCDWDGANLARWHAEKTYPDLVRLFGIEPARKPHFFVLRNLEQYNQAASSGLLGESEGFSSLHGAYFSDAFFDRAAAPQYLGCGVSYWDRQDPKLAVWGPYWVRWAAAQSFIDAIDPSWRAVGARSAAPGGDLAAYATDFWAEKKIPRWLRYGAAAYAERFLKDPEAAEGADPWAIRAFAFAELKKAGGLRKLDEVFAFPLSLTDIPASARLYNEAGLLVSFLLDGAEGNRDVGRALDEFRGALKSGKKDECAAAAVALQKALAKHESEIKKFAGL
ncbi:MAG: hypothetical protein IPK67_10690 [Planctomycetes bacterium]|nr:hypothetical protein [Planctomycetota bacterium]